MNDENDMQELFRLAHEAYQDRCIGKAEIYGVIQTHGLFKGLDLTSRSGQTVFGSLLNSFASQTFGGITLKIHKKSKNNIWFCFAKTIGDISQKPSESEPLSPTSTKTPVDMREANAKEEEEDHRKSHYGDWIEAFLACYRVTGNITRSSEAAGISRATFYWRKERDPQFAKAANEAWESAIDTLVEAARKRAMEKSDILTIFLLKNMAPDRFNHDRTEVKHTGSVQHALVTFSADTLRVIEEARAERSKPAISGRVIPELGLTNDIVADIEAARNGRTKKQEEHDTK